MCKIQRLKTGQMRQILEDTAGKLRAAEIETLQTLPGSQRSDTVVGDELGVIEVQFGNGRERLEVLHANVGDTGVGQVKAAQMRQRPDARKIGVSDPTRSQIDRYNSAGAVLRAV